MQTYASDILYHFVGREHANEDARNFGVLCELLRSMEVRPNLIRGQSGITYRVDPNRPLQHGELIEQSVSCFCDIPRCQLKHIHAGKYGRFGVGVARRWLADCGGRPVSYVPVLSRSPCSSQLRLLKEAREAWVWLDRYFCQDLPDDTVRIEGEPPESAQEAAARAASFIAKDVMAFLKAYDPELPDDHPENYYMEREWRKYGALPLGLALREILVPKRYLKEMIQLFPRHADRIHEL